MSDQGWRAGRGWTETSMRLSRGDGRTGGEDAGGDRGRKGFGMRCGLAAKSAIMGKWAVVIKFSDAE
jgi:hypothetical protein